MLGTGGNKLLPPVCLNSYGYNNPVKYFDPTGHFTEEAIYNYLLDYECGGAPICADDTMELWSQDEAFWTMLLEAQAGDVLIGKDRDIYEFFHTFTGEGKDLLTGIYRSDGNGNPVTGNYQDFKLNNYYRGRTGSSYSPDCCFSWLGFIRWNEENGQKIPSFWLPPGATWRQTRMANWAIFAQDATWILTGAAVGWMLPEAVAAAEGLAKLAPITSFGTSILFDIVNYPKTYRNITGTQANDLTVTITYNHSVAEMVFREEYPGYWNYQDLWFK